MRCETILVHPPYRRRKGGGVVFPLGLGYLASAAQAQGYKTEILDCALLVDRLTEQSLKRTEVFLSHALEKLQPRLLIGIGPVTAAATPSLLSIVKTCRECSPGVPVICGGPLASTRGQEWFFFDVLGVDGIVAGDAEKAFVNVLSTANRGQPLVECEYVTTPQSSALVENVVEDLDALNYPLRQAGGVEGYRPSLRRDLFVYPATSMVGSRGCTYRCAFCASGSLRSGRYHRRSYSSIAAEIRHLERAGFRSVTFYDDSLFPSPLTVNEDIASFCQSLPQGSSLLWQIEMRSDVACDIDPTIVRLMVDTGCRQINLGLEKATPDGMFGIGKSLQSGHAMAACDNLRRSAPGLRLAGTFILGGPGETASTAQETIALSLDLGLLYAHFNPLQLYPGTGLYSHVVGDDRLWYAKTLNNPQAAGELVYESPELSVSDLLSLVDIAYERFYMRPEWEAIAERFLGVEYPRVRAALDEVVHDRLNLKREFDDAPV